MITEVIYCRHCGSGDIVKNGFAPNKTVSREVPLSCLRASEPRGPCSQRLHTRAQGGDPSRLPGAAFEPAPRGLRRTFNVSPTPRSLAASKKLAALGLRETLVVTPGEKVLELDELWSFVYRKGDKVWV